MRHSILWLDKYNIEYKNSEISDLFLKRIIVSLSNGRGSLVFCTKDQINRIFKEAYRRRLCRLDILFNLHARALWSFGFTSNAPKATVYYDGIYLK